MHPSMLRRHSIVRLPATSSRALLVAVLLLELQPALILGLLSVGSCELIDSHERATETYNLLTLSVWSTLVSPGMTSLAASTIIS